MENRKLYEDMTVEEQKAYRQKYEEYVSKQLPLLTAEAPSADDIKARTSALVAGFSLSTAFSFCREFVRERTAWGDYSVGVCKALADYFVEIKKIVEVSQNSSQTEEQVDTSTLDDGKVHFGVVANPTVLPQRHRGRPTKTEAKEYKKAVENKKKAEEKVSPSMFPTAPTGDVSPDTEGVKFTLSMQQYKWLLSADLQHDVDGLRDYRTAFSDASQKAKFLAEQYGENSTEAQKKEIAGYAEEAKQMNAIIEGIYQNADRELAEVCVRLKYDPHYTNTMSGKGVNTEDMRIALLPYLRKQSEDFKQKIIDKIHEEDPKLARERKLLADAKARVDAVRKYLLRTDKPATAKRIATMEKRIEELRKLDKKFPSLKIEPDSYLPVLEKTKADLAEDPNPSPSPSKGKGVDSNV